MEKQTSIYPSDPSGGKKHRKPQKETNEALSDKKVLIFSFAVTDDVDLYIQTLSALCLHQQL